MISSASFTMASVLPVFGRLDCRTTFYSLPFTACLNLFPLIGILSRSKNGRSNPTQISYNKAVYTALVAPSRPKRELVTDGPTDRPTDGRTHPHIESLRRD